MFIVFGEDEFDLDSGFQSLVIFGKGLVEPSFFCFADSHYFDFMHHLSILFHGLFDVAFFIAFFDGSAFVE